jgi:hypothetical protein
LSITKSHMTTPGFWTPGRRGGKPATNRLSYGAAFLYVYMHFVAPTNCWITHVQDGTMTLNLEQILSIFHALISRSLCLGSSESPFCGDVDSSQQHNPFCGSEGPLAYDNRCVVMS